jgi:hypothetical protein
VLAIAIEVNEKCSAIAWRCCCQRRMMPSKRKDTSTDDDEYRANDKEFVHGSTPLMVVNGMAGRTE